MTGPLLGAVVVASNRAAAGVYEDATGPLLVEFLTRLGFATGAPAVVPDGEAVGDAIRAAVEAGARVADVEAGSTAAFAGDASLFSADRFHPSSAGYAVIAAALAPAIRAAALAGPRPAA